MQPNARLYSALSEPFFFSPLSPPTVHCSSGETNCQQTSFPLRAAVRCQQHRKLHWPTICQPWRRDSKWHSSCRSHLKTWDDWTCPPLLHPLSCPLQYLHLNQSGCFTFVHVSRCDHHVYICTHMHMQGSWQHCWDMSLPVTVWCTGIEQSHPPMCTASVPTHDRSHCVQLYENSLKCQNNCCTKALLK